MELDCPPILLRPWRRGVKSRRRANRYLFQNVAYMRDQPAAESACSRSSVCSQSLAASSAAAMALTIDDARP